MSAVQKRTPVLWTEEEYLDREETAAEKHEFIDGQIYLMAGTSYEHAVLCSAVNAALGPLCARHGCQVLTGDMRVRTAAGRFYYPDVSVVCGKPDLLPAARPRRTATLQNPSAIVEVLCAQGPRAVALRHFR